LNIYTCNAFPILYGGSSASLGYYKRLSGRDINNNINNNNIQHNNNNGKKLNMKGNAASVSNAIKGLDAVKERKSLRS